MSGISERLSDEFARWESRGRGWWVSEYPVRPEPLFYPFPGHGLLIDRELPDDGRRPTALSAFLRRLRGGPVTAEEPREREGRKLDGFERQKLSELRLLLPTDLRFQWERYAGLFSALGAAFQPITFELVADGQGITCQCAVSTHDERLFARQMGIFFQSVPIAPAEKTLRERWNESEGHIGIVEFGLGKEFMLPLASPSGDPLAGLVGALSDIDEGEVGVFQVICEPARHPWHESIIRAVSDGRERPFFENAPELLTGARQKLRHALWAAVVRIAVKAPDPGRLWEIAANMGASLGVFGGFETNELVPLRNDFYPPADHEDDLIFRQSRRSGMILNAAELAGFFHVPSSDIATPKLLRERRKTKAVPSSLRADTGLLIGENVHLGLRTPVRLSPEARKRHCHIIGASGTGKSTLLFNLISQDIQSGEGLAVLDPHGDLIDRILSTIPESRIADVVLVDPSDKEYSVGFNILHAHSELEKTLLASDLVAIFQRASSAWGDQLESVLRHAILAFLESEEGGSLSDLRRFLLEPEFRDDFLRFVRDPDVVYFWRRGFRHLLGGKSVGSVLTRLETFLSQKAIRRMVTQKENRLDFGAIMDGRKILLAKLSQGLIGRENSYLLGSLLVAKLQQLAMARAGLAESRRHPFFLYIDEFADFITPSMAEILSGARKYGLGLILAHHELQQLEQDKDVLSAVLSHCFTRVSFRVSDHDARILANGFASFEAQDLQNLETGEAIARIERSDFDFNLSVAQPKHIDETAGAERRARVIEASRAAYATRHAEIDTPRPVIFRKDKPSAGEEPKPAVMPADLGRGGAEHQAIQKQIKEAAEAVGFRAVIEKQILDGAGSVDVFLERGGQRIACEITVTTTIEQEVRNIAKCIRAGFSTIAAVAVSAEKLEKLSQAVSNSLPADVLALVSYHTPDAFVAYLQSLPAAPPTPSPTPPQAEGETMNRGYKVKRKYVALSPEQAKTKEAEAIKLIADTIRKNKTKEPYK